MSKAILLITIASMIISGCNNPDKKGMSTHAMTSNETKQDESVSQTVSV